MNRMPSSTGVVNWTMIQDELVAPSQASVLMIFDCCNTSGAVEWATEGGSQSNGPKELLGACEAGDETQYTWFSLRVAHELWRAATSDAGGTSTLELYQRLFASFEERRRPPALPAIEKLSNHPTGIIRLRPQTPAHLQASTKDWPTWDEVYLSQFAPLDNCTIEEVHAVRW